MTILDNDFVLENVAGIWLGYSKKLRNAGIKHTFSTRLHGKSIVHKNNLNLSTNVNDNNEYIVENRKALAAALNVEYEKCTAAQQVHGTNVVYVDESYIGRGHDGYATAIPATDALITDLHSVPLMIFGADCVPIIIADPLKKVVGVVHSGWQGTVDMVLTVALKKMQNQFNVDTKDMYAVIGPSIGACCYQVDKKVYEKAETSLVNYRNFFADDGENKWKFDLWSANFEQLKNMGLKEENICVSSICTACNREIFFSHRADHGKTGRFAGLVWL